MSYCDQCGTKFTANARFCDQCGAAVEPTLSQKAPQPPAAGPMPPVTARQPGSLELLQRKKGFKQLAVGGIVLIAFLLYVVFSNGNPPAPNDGKYIPPGPATDQTASREIKLQLEKYNAGFFTIDKPVGWQVTTGGYGSTFCYSVQDPGEPLRQIVSYGEIGPAYLSERQKQIDRSAVNMGATIAWLDAPVVAPLTPENYLTKIPQILQGNFMRSIRVLPGPAWQNFQIIEVVPQKTMFSAPDAKSALIRALFTQNNKVGEGLFLVTVFTFMPENGTPAFGISYAVCFTAITAPQPEFRFIEDSLSRSVGSAALSQDYIAEATRNANSNWARIFAAGQTMRETSDIIINGWQQRNKIYDRIAEKRADTIRGVERVYDPSTNQVYTVNNGWYDNYNANRGQYQNSRLLQLPNESPLYLEPARDGGQLR